MLATGFRHSVAALVACVAACGAISARAQAPILEHAVKATYLHKIAAFVEWPASAFEAADSPLVLCVAGNDPVGRLVVEAASGRTYGMRAISVRRVAQPAATTGCHILYVAGLRDDAIATYLESVRDKPVLTITDGAVERRVKGAVNFLIRDNRVRFEIDLDLAAAQHLLVSSKLVGIAARVVPQP